ncbi:putative small nucleolar ribonucleoprotein complex subunit utp14 protein [Rosellinia necatrix]|uniref:Putative small nucleolar ribonucleoprotein complex subunit utp14 protein n=1 Tax=Rosellinia necatrix TaxID=77044 RepID=A0A1W2TFG9_ROSNE|nr:putative small nucleolar ribonucleoprotein complex subunit utp14 protein [Rosellinia necatrix]
MPGRQAHGRPLISAKSGDKGGKRWSKAKANSKALDAYAAAQAEIGQQDKRTPRNRQLDVDFDDDAPRRKHARGNQDDEDDDEDEAPPRKVRRGTGRDGDDDVEYGSDSSGNSWRMGKVDSDDDSDVNSDEAFGESDEENISLPKSKNKKNKKKRTKEDDDDDDDDDEDEDIGDADGASLGSDAIDLAAALDMSMSEDDEQPAGSQDGEEDDEDDEDEDDSEDSGNESSDVESDIEDHAEDANINAWVSQFAGTKDEDEDEAQTTTSKPKLGLKELGLLGVKDSELKKSLKFMTKDERATKKQKLDIPLARRAQAKIDRSAAAEKTNESLGRWLETVKAMRRADTSLVFPLPQHEVGLARHDNSELAPLTQKTAGTELESTIMAIMEESGLSLSAKPKEKAVFINEDGQTISRKAMLQQKRQERELRSREEARAKRIKKIKSKAYHRVHRRQRERDELKEREIMIASGEVDSEDERERLDRQRATERMGARHRESKWAKQANKNGRAAWDEDVRVGVTEMARRDEELRRRIEGKNTNKGSDDESDGSDDSVGSDVDERVQLLRQLKTLDAAEDSEPESKLMKMEFMRKAEARRKQENDQLIADMRRELASDAEDQSESDHVPEEIGRRIFGQPTSAKHALKATKPSKKETAEKQAQVQEDASNAQEVLMSRSKILSASTSQEHDMSETAGAWSQPMASSKKRRGKNTGPSTDILDIDINSVAVSAQPPAPAPAKTKPQKNGATAQAEYSSDDEDQHLPIQFREQELIERAFGGLDVFEAEFQAEKDAAIAEDDEKTIETTLPGWGAWVGEGITKREKNQRRFFTKKEGVKPDARKDFQNNRAIINEKRVKKNDKYLASQLPHQYESRAQYERSLRLPIGPEFLTKQSFQEATKPRVIIKQGIIAPISKPTH